MDRILLPYPLKLRKKCLRQKKLNDFFTPYSPLILTIKANLIFQLFAGKEIINIL